MDVTRIEGQVGPVSSFDGVSVALRLGRNGDVITSSLHGRYYEQASRGQVFYACNQAAQAVSVALATTYTGLCLSNPVGSGYNLSILQVSYALTVAPAAIASMGLIGGSASTNVTHTAALTPGSTKIGATLTAVGKADSQATIATPVWVIPFLGGFTAAALPSTSPAILDVGGSIVLTPGAFIAIGALTAVTGFGGIIWEEIPV